VKWYYNVAFIVLVMVSTLLIRVPVPAGGYFNLGDALIVFIALVGGSASGALAGGLGSALADLIGFPIFAPITLVAKGLLGFVAGLGKGRNIVLSITLPFFGELIMVAIYFCGTWLLPSLGKAAAVADLVPNLIQGFSGVLGGKLLFTAWQSIAPRK